MNSINTKQAVNFTKQLAVNVAVGVAVVSTFSIIGGVTVRYLRKHI